MHSHRMNKLVILIVALSFAICFGAGTAHADTVKQVTAKVETEYAAGHMDTSTYNDLMSVLGSAKIAANVENYNAATEGYNVLVDTMAGITIDGAASDRLRATFDPK